MSSTSSSPPPELRNVTSPKAYGYTLDSSDIYRQVIEDGTAVEGQFNYAVWTYLNRLATHCGIESSDLMAVCNDYNPDPEMPLALIYCVVAATNQSRISKIPRMDIIEKAKEFLGTTEEPKWHRLVVVYPY